MGSMTPKRGLSSCPLAKSGHFDAGHRVVLQLADVLDSMDGL